MKTFFSISDLHYKKIKEHLFPGDGKEAVAIALCGRSQFDNHYGLLVHDIFLIPYEEYFDRTPDRVHWPTSLIRPLLEKALKFNLSIAKIHCHPGGGEFFSDIDNQSDTDLFDSIYGWISDDGPHASLIMLPDGRLFGRFITPDIQFKKIDRVKVSGDDIYIWDNTQTMTKFSEFDLRNIQVFGAGTMSIFKKLRIGIVGCSGTGSPVAEQLCRLGVGQLYLVDPDVVEEKNLNRIISSRRSDIGRFKTETLKDQMGQYSDTEIHSFPVNLYDDSTVMRLLSTCDILFGCMDSIDGRHLLNHIATFYLIPYIDVGVKLVADGKGGVDKICYTVNFLKPGQSLMARKVYSPEALRDASLYRADPDEFNKRLEEGYVSNAVVESPAVITVNMKAASNAVSELLARLHRYRYDSNESLNIQRWEDVDAYYKYQKDTSHDALLQKYIGRGDMTPFLNMPQLSKAVI